MSIRLLLALALSACADAPRPVATDTAAPGAVGSENPAAEAGAGTPSEGASAAVPMVDVGATVSVRHAESGATRLTLRGGPSTATPRLGTFGDGVAVACQDRTFDEAWCRVEAETTDGPAAGWAKRRHLVYVGNVAVEADGVRMFGDPGVWGMPGGFPVGARWDILADDGYANVRAEGMVGAEIVGRLDNRTMTTVESCGPAVTGRVGSRWCRISAPVEGWVHQSGFHPDLREL